MAPGTFPLSRETMRKHTIASHKQWSLCKVIATLIFDVNEWFTENGQDFCFCLVLAQFVFMLHLIWASIKFDDTSVLGDWRDCIDWAINFNEIKPLLLLMAELSFNQPWAEMWLYAKYFLYSHIRSLWNANKKHNYCANARCEKENHAE